MTVAEILDANRGPHGWDRSRAESAINEALELAALEADNLRCSYAIAAHEAGAIAARDEIATRIRALKSPAGPVQPSQEQEPESA